jgi:hypothetical protein
MTDIPPYTSGEFARSNSSLLSVTNHWDFHNYYFVNVPIGHFSHPEKLLRVQVEFVPLEDNHVFDAIVLALLADNMANVAVRVPFPLRRVSLEYGGIIYPAKNKSPPPPPPSPCLSFATLPSISPSPCSSSSCLLPPLLPRPRTRSLYRKLQHWLLYIVVHIRSKLRRHAHRVCS